MLLLMMSWFYQDGRAEKGWRRFLRLEGLHEVSGAFHRGQRRDGVRHLRNPRDPMILATTGSCRRPCEAKAFGSAAEDV